MMYRLHCLEQDLNSFIVDDGIYHQQKKLLTESGLEASLAYFSSVYWITGDELCYLAFNHH